MTVNDTDKFLVNRSGSSYHLEAQNLMAELQDDDLMLVNRAGKSYKATGAEIKDSLGPKGSINKPVILSPGQNAGIGDSSYYPKTSEITNVSGTGVVTLTVQNENTYNADGGADMGQPISETFLRDQIVNGVKAGSESAVGKVIENATGTRLSVFEYSSPVINTESVPDAVWTGIAYGLDHFVSCGHGKIMYATDPTGPWTAYSPPALENWKGIAYGNGKFVVVGSANISQKIMYASDPKGPWTLVTAPNQNNWTNVDFVNGYFVATSGDTTSNKQLIYATDPAGFWTEVQMPESASWTGVAYGNGYYVAISSSASENNIVYATDLSGPWQVPASKPDNEILQTIVYADGVFVAAGTNRILYTTDPTDAWTLASLPEYDVWQSFAYGGGRFVGIGKSTSKLVHATNPAGPWESVSTPTSSNWNDLVYANGEYVGVGSSQLKRVVHLSVFGGPWQVGMEVFNENSITQYGPDADELEFVGSIPAGTDINTWGDAVWEVVEAGNLNTFMVDRKAITVSTSTQSLLPADRNNIALEPDTTYQARLRYTSTDPALESEYSDVVTFKTGAEPVIDLGDWDSTDVETSSWKGVTYGGGFFVAVGGQYKAKQIMYATEGAGPWTAVEAPNSASIDLFDVAYGDGYFVAVSRETGVNQVIYATNPAGPWTSVSASSLSKWSSIAYGNGTFVACAQEGNDRIMYASNPAGPWTSVVNSALNYKTMHTIIYDNINDYFVISADDKVYYARNPAGPWTIKDAAFNASWYGIAYGDGLYVSCGGGRMMYTNDLANPWAQYVTSQAYRSIAFGNGRFVAVNNSGANQIMYSDDPTDSSSWTQVVSPASSSWWDVTYGNGQFVAISFNGGTDGVMYTKKGTTRYYDETNQRAIYDQEIVARFGIDPETTSLEPYGIAELTEQPDYPVAGYTPDGDKYRPIEDLSGVVAALEAEVTALTDG